MKFNLKLARRKKEERIFKLSKEESLILFEFLSRFLKEEKYQFHDSSEEAVLAGILCDLESSLVEPFMSNYDLLLEESRKKLRWED